MEDMIILYTNHKCGIDDPNNLEKYRDDTNVFGLLFPVVLCGGHAVVEELNLTTTFGLLSLMLIAKFLFSTISFGSGAPGGIFFPLLIIGGTFGALFGYIAIKEGF